MWVQSLDWTTGLDYWTTGLDYWTHPNCKIHVVQCRIKLNVGIFIHSVTSLTLLSSVFPRVSRGKTTRAYIISVSFNHRQAYIIEE